MKSSPPTILEAISSNSFGLGAGSIQRTASDIANSANCRPLIVACRVSLQLLVERLGIEFRAVVSSNYGGLESPVLFLPGDNETLDLFCDFRCRRRAI